MANILNKFLDFIGLVDEPAAGRDDDFPATQGRGRGGNTSTRKKTSIANDEFANEPRMTRVSNTRGSGPNNSNYSNYSGNMGSNRSVNNDQFDANEAWEQPKRPEYGARTQQNAQSNRPTANGRYTSDYRTNAQEQPRSTSRYEGRTSDYSYGDSNGYSARDPYRTTNSGYTSSTYSGRTASNASSNYYGGTDMNEQGMSSSRHVDHYFANLSIRSVDECKMVIRTLLENKSVLLNLEEMDSVQAQRAVDTMSGATYAIGAKMNRAAERAWLLTPCTVKVDDGAQPQDNGTFGTQR